MTLTVAVLMDPEPLKTTVVMVEELLNRGHKVMAGEGVNLSIKQGRVVGRFHPVTLAAGAANKPIEERLDVAEADELIDLESLDAIFIREDKAFNMAYVSAASFLEKVKHKTAVINDPTTLRTTPGKFLPTQFPDLIPPTLITNSRKEIEDFRKTYQDIIIKPMYGLKGSSVFHLAPDSKNLGSLLQTMFEVYREPMVVQQFLPDASKGDKRIFIVGGEPVAAINRVPSGDDVRSNLEAGGKPEECSLNERDLEICNAIKSTLIKTGLDVVGIDVIGGFLIEVNMLAPGGFGHVENDGLTMIAAKTADLIEKRATNIKRGGRPASGASVPAVHQPNPLFALLGKLFGALRNLIRR